MPQLDKVTFLSQFFWLCLSFITFYFLILKNFLPKMSRILKFRRKKIQEGLTFLTSENNAVLKQYDSLIAQSLNRSKNFFNINIDHTLVWVQSLIYDLNWKSFAHENSDYLQSLGQASLFEYIALNPTNSLIEDSLFTEFMVKQLD